MAQFVEVIAAGKGWTRVRDETGRELTLKGNRNWRNNNPGNIEYGPFARSMGAIGSDGRFAIFPTYEAGRSAKENLLFSSGGYAGKTIAQAISRYAPPNENNTTGYINSVTGHLGVSPHAPLSSLSANQRQMMLDAMERVEGYKVGEIRNAQGVKLPPSEVPQVATALDVIERAAPRPATPSAALGYARAEMPAGTPIVPVPTPRPERQRTAPVPAPRMERAPFRTFAPGEFIENPDGSRSTERAITWQMPDGKWVNTPTLFMGPNGPIDLSNPDQEPQARGAATALMNTGRQFPTFDSESAAVSAAKARSDAGGAGGWASASGRTAPVPAMPSLPMQSIRAANAATNPQLQAALESRVGRSAPTPATPSFFTRGVRDGRIPPGRTVNSGQIPIGLMDVARSPNAATPRLEADGSVRSPMSVPPTPASAEQRVTARNAQFAPPPLPQRPPARTYGQSSLVQDSFAALPPAPLGLQTALNNYAGNGVGSMPSFAALQDFAGTNVPERLTAGIAELPGPGRVAGVNVAQIPPLPRARPETGIGGPLPPIAATPLPPPVSAAPRVPPVPAPRLERPGIFGKPMIGNWEVPLPGVLGHIQNFTAAMNNASGPFNNGFDNLLAAQMRGGNFLAPGAATGHAGGFLYAPKPGGGYTNVGRVTPNLTPSQRYDAMNSRNRRESTGSAARDSDYWSQATGGNSGVY